MFPYVNTHTHHEGKGINILDIGDGFEYMQDLELSSLDPGQEVFYSMGKHPMDVGPEVDEELEWIENSLFDTEVIAVGECGLDRRSPATMEEQERVLLAQVRLAEEYHKPLIIHCVKAYPELIAIRKGAGSSVQWVIHGFNSNEEILRKLLDHDFYISVGAALLNPQSNAFQLIRKIPSGRLFLESDDRVVRISEVYEAAFQAIGVEEGRLREKLWENYKKVFNR